MKKLASLLLTLSLIFSLAAPVLAVETDIPTWQEWGYTSLEEYLTEYGGTVSDYYAWTATPTEQKVWVAGYAAQHPAEAAAFDPDTYFAESYGNDYDKAEYMSDNGLTTDAEFHNALMSAWISEQMQATEYAAKWAALCAAKPERTAQFLSQLDSWLMVEYGYPDFAAYLADNAYAYAEENYYHLFEEWNWSYEQEQAQRAAQDARITALGGTPGQMNVLLNGKCLPLTAEQIQSVDGAVSLPADLLSKALGVTVKGEAGGYAPIRASAEAAGFEVFWDQDYQTVVLVDRKGISAKLDADLSQAKALLTRAIAAFQPEAGQAYASSENLTANVKRFNTLDGDSAYNLSCKASAIQKDGSISGSVTLDVAGLLRQLGTEEQARLTELLPQKLTLSQLISLAAGLQINYILDRADESLSFNIPALATFVEGYEKDTWVKLDMAGLSDLVGTAEIGSLGAMIYDFAAPATYGNDYLNYHSNLTKNLTPFTALLGNDRFTEQNGTLTYKLDTKTVNDLIANLTKDSYSGPTENAFRAADLSLSLTGGGKLSAGFNLRPNIAALTGGVPVLSGVVSAFDFLYKGDMTISTEQSKLTGELHWKNQFQVKLDATSTTKKTAETPKSAPAEESCMDMGTFWNLLSTSFYAPDMGAPKTVPIYRRNSL